jgi:uncharacterized membrane protein YqaE (UPF0057 family)
MGVLLIVSLLFLPTKGKGVRTALFLDEKLLWLSYLLGVLKAMWFGVHQRPEMIKAFQ